MKHIGQFSIGYQFLRYWIKFSLLKLFYKKVEVCGLEKVDPKKPIIFAPNHQNALLDALLLVTSLKQQPIFLARADIFEKPILVRIFRFFKMLPVYRIRDGFDTLKKNEEIFDECVQALSDHSTLILFPEGNHAGLKRIRPLKKGLARIAFEAEARNDFKLGLQVIPVGIDYYDYRKFRSKVSVIFGDPIEMQAFKEVYEENQQVGLRQLNMAITDGIKPHMIEIPWPETYDFIMKIRDIFGERYHKKFGNGKRGLLDKFSSHKKLISTLGKYFEEHQDEIESINSKMDFYLKKVKEYNFRDHVFARAPYSLFSLFLRSILMLVLLPVYLFGAINNYIIFKVPDWFTTKKIRDAMFRSSIAYGSAFLVLLPILYAIQTTIVAIFTPTWWIPVLYLLSLIPAGLFAIHYSFWYKKLVAMWRFSRLDSRKNQDILKMKETRKWLIEKFDSIIAG